MKRQTLRSFIVRLFSFVGAVVFLGVIVAAVCVFGAKRPVPPKVILEANFESSLVAYVPDDPVAKIVSGRTPTVLSVVEALERATTDDRVVGLIARVGEAGWSAAQIQEIRDAVIAFRAKGKTAIAYAETFGEGSRGTARIILPRRSTRFACSRRANWAWQD